MDTASTILTWAGLLLGVGFWTYMQLSSIGAIVLARMRRGSKPSGMGPYVTVIRPLCGMEYKLKENLESMFQQNYQRFELIMAVASPTDESIPLVKSLIRKYPNVNASLMLDPSATGVNPKVCNLVRAYERAKYDVIWVCDSNVVVGQGSLGRAAELMMDPKVGLVHHLPFGISAPTTGGQLDAVFLNTYHAKMYSTINWLGLAPCVIGKSCLYRRTYLEEAGGMRAFMDRLSEDQLIATAIWDAGYRHVLAPDLVYNRVGAISSASHFQRRIRWCRLRKFMAPLAVICEPFTESVLIGMIASKCFQLILSWDPLIFFVGHMLVWYLLDLQLMYSLSRRPLRFRQFQSFTASWLLREFTAFPVYLYSISGNSFWRQTTYKITEGTRVIPAPNHPTAFKQPLISALGWVSDRLLTRPTNSETNINSALLSKSSPAFSYNANYTPASRNSFTNDNSPLTSVSNLSLDFPHRPEHYLVKVADPIP